MTSKQRRSPKFERVVAPLLPLYAVACSGDCPTLRECDIRDSSCQQQTAEVAACLRGGTAVLAPVVVVDAQAFVESQVADAQNNPESADARDLRRGLALLSLASWNADQSTVIRDYWNDVAAFYSSKTGKVTVLDRGRPVDGPSAVRLLVHEFVHAMQHQDLGDDYYTRHSATYDADLALTGMTEGEAVLYQDLATAFGYDRDPNDIDWNAIFGGYQSRESDLARGDESPYEMASLRFPYAFGGAYLNRAWRAGGSAAVRRAFSRPPASTRQMLAGYGAMNASGLPWQDDPNDAGTPILPPEFQSVATKHLGSWIFHIFRDIWAAPGVAPQGSRDSGYAGDVLSVFRTSAISDVTTVWRIRFETSDEAASMLSTLTAEPWLVASRIDRDIVLIASTDDTVPPRITGGLTWTASPDVDSTVQTSQASALSASVPACPLR